MKRYRVLNFDFDTRVQTLVDPINEEWEEKVKELHLQNRQKTEQSLLESYGVLNKVHFPRNSGHTKRLGYNTTLKP